MRVHEARDDDVFSGIEHVVNLGRGYAPGLHEFNDLRTADYDAAARITRQNRKRILHPDCAVYSRDRVGGAYAYASRFIRSTIRAESAPSFSRSSHGTLPSTTSGRPPTKEWRTRNSPPEITGAMVRSCCPK